MKKQNIANFCHNEVMWIVKHNKLESGDNYNHRLSFAGQDSTLVDDKIQRLTFEPKHFRSLNLYRLRHNNS